MRLDIGVYGARGIPSTYSGYETFLSVLLPQLARSGHEVTMYCRRTHLDDDSPYEGVQRVLHPAAGGFRFETLSHGLSSSVVARLRGHDVVFAVNIANAPYCLLARASGQRTVLNTDGQEWIRGKWGRAARAYWRLCARLAGASASALVTDSKRMQEIYRNDFKANSTVIPYCWSELTPAADPTSVLERFSLERHRYFVVAARLNPENSVVELARAYEDSGCLYPFVVLGAANYASPVLGELQRLAQRGAGLTIVGHVSDRRRFATLLANAAAYLHGHQVGGINPSLLEAMGCGANIIALATPFNREALGPTGRYFSDFDRELPQLLRSTEAERAPAGAARRGDATRRAVERFGLGAVAGAYERLFCQVAQRSPWATTSTATPWCEERWQEDPWDPRATD